MGPGRGFFDPERCGDLAVGEAAGNQVEHLAFAWGELVELGLVGELGSRLLRMRSITRRVTDGESGECSAAIMCTAASISSGRVRLSRKPRGVGAQAAEDVVVLLTRTRAQPRLSRAEPPFSRSLDVALPGGARRGDDPGYESLGVASTELRDRIGHGVVGCAGCRGPCETERCTRFTALRPLPRAGVAAPARRTLTTPPRSFRRQSGRCRLR